MMDHVLEREEVEQAVDEPVPEWPKFFKFGDLNIPELRFMRLLGMREPAHVWRHDSAQSIAVFWSSITPRWIAIPGATYAQTEEMLAQRMAVQIPVSEAILITGGNT